MNEETIFYAIPVELQRMVFDYCDGVTLVRCGITCKFWNSICLDEALWKVRFDEDYGIQVRKVYNGWRTEYSRLYGEEKKFFGSIDKKTTNLGTLTKVKGILTGWIGNAPKEHDKDVKSNDHSTFVPMIVWATHQGHWRIVQRIIARTDKTIVLTNMKAFFSGTNNTTKYPWWDRDLQSSLVQYGDCLLHIAASLGKTNCVRVLIAAGANVDHLPKDNETPFYWAARMGYCDIMQLLADAGCNVNQTNTGGGSPFERSLREGRVKAAEWCLNNDKVKTSPSGLITYILNRCNRDVSDEIRAQMLKLVIPFQQDLAAAIVAPISSYNRTSAIECAKSSYPFCFAVLEEALQKTNSD
eukprot:TRINITY_DN6312_c0_g1_i1.p1 TRINITY_DN6312_c0_g1~~TRINITY_DN6312_c0_g1_i1.p1  ORF type:complete len:355 (-),score=37.02 TRINITY_DN6312_c0_g1_i1:49-1113(-)